MNSSFQVSGTQAPNVFKVNPVIQPMNTGTNAPITN